MVSNSTGMWAASLQYPVVSFVPIGRIRKDFAEELNSKRV